MTEIAFILAPLLVLPLVSLFRFVGCGLTVTGSADPVPPAGQPMPGPGPSLPPPSQPPTPPSDGKPPKYRDYILGESTTGTVKHPIKPNKADVIGYWRLTDPAGSTVAKDEKGFQDGTYVSGPDLPNVNPTAALGGSELAPGDIEEGKTGLIVSDPMALGRSFKGGFVRVPFKPDLHTDEFTIEAWIVPPPSRPNYEHILFDTGGRYALPGSTARDRGFRVFEDRTGHWQVRVALDATAVYASPPLMPRPDRSHFALVMQNSGAAGAKQLMIYMNGKLTVSQTLPSYARPDDVPLFIGVENTTTTVAGAPVFRHPFMSQIQEVVLHKKPLSAEEIDNHVDINR